jgi:type VI protein secretion system component VasF
MKSKRHKHFHLANIYLKAFFMSLETIITDDQAAVAAAQSAVQAAQAALDAANAKLAGDQSALQAATPLLDLLTQVESLAQSQSEPTRSATLTLTAQIRALY